MQDKKHSGKGGYGKRECLFCGKAFEAHTLYSFFCSEKCRLARHRENDRIWSRQRRKKMREEVECLKENVDWLNCELENVKSKARRLQVLLGEAQAGFSLEKWQRAKR